MKIHNKPFEIQQGVAIPEALVRQMDEYIMRNALVDFGENHSLRGTKIKCRYRCCPRCLKAFSLVKAKEMNLEQESADFLDAIFNCEIGHDGYFLDGEDISKIVSLHRDV